MDLKSILKRGALALGLSAVATLSIAQESVTLKIADQFPTTHIGSTAASQAFIKGVEARSEGRIKMQYFPAQQIAKAAALLDAVRNRVTDIALVGVVYNTDKLPLTSAAELPGIATDSVKASEAFSAYIAEDLLEREFLPLGVRPLWGTILTPYQITLGERDGITDLAGIQGNKLRVAGATGELIAESLDAVPVKAPASDLYLSLQRGTVDGAIMNVTSLFAYKLEEVFTGVSRNASLGTVAFALLVNEDVWQSLSEADRALLQEVASEVRLSFSQAIEAHTDNAYGKLTAAGVPVFSLSDDVLADMQARLSTVRQTWIDQVSARGLPAQEMLEAFTARLEE